MEYPGGELNIQSGTIPREQEMKIMTALKILSKDKIETALNNSDPALKIRSRGNIEAPVC